MCVFTVIFIISKQNRHDMRKDNRVTTPIKYFSFIIVTAYTFFALPFDES